MKAIYNKLMAGITLDVENLKTFSPKCGTKQGCPLLPFSFNIGSPI
jgi:hypothetical protein